LDYSIPKSLKEIFSSWTNNKPIAGAFDIQPRVLALSDSPIVLNGTLQGMSIGIQYVLLDDKVEAVEGLIVDTRVGNASVGFRNHTIPRTQADGAQWTEDILFIEPLTSCIGTIQYRRKSSNGRHESNSQLYN
jgi:hypothetical protein